MKKGLANQNSIISYQNQEIKVEVKVENETVWLTQKQMSDLFQTTRNNITLHISNLFREKELEINAVGKDFLLSAPDGKFYNTKHYKP